MFGIVTGLTIVLIIFAHKSEDSPSNKKEKIYALLSFGTFVLLILSIILLFVGLFYTPQKELEYSHKIDIYALEDNFTVQGSRWYFEEDDKYYYLSDYKDGKKMYHISKNNSYIVESDETSPSVEVYKEVVKGGKLKQWLFKAQFLGSEYKITVPSKTLTNEFNIDMKK